MSTLEQILSAIILSLLSGIVGKYLGERGKVNVLFCAEHQRSCQQLLLEKLTNLERQVEALTKIVNGKLLGL